MSASAAGRTTRSQSRSPVKPTTEPSDERPKRQLGSATTPSPSKRARKVSPISTSRRRTPTASPSKQDLFPSLSQASLASSSSSAATQDEALLPPLVAEQDAHLYTTVPHPTLPFSLPDAITHLTQIDSRFHKIVSQVPAKPFQELAPTSDIVIKELNLHKTLTTSIVGQQISWLAARSVLYKFVRLFFPDCLPAAPDFDATPREVLPFPTPHQILSKSDVELRSAGLSGQKVKYVRDVSRRFADGRLDARRLVQMQEEEVIAELVKIKGVGVWTAEMTLMFALRRPNVLPVGDLGIQRGMVLFYLSEPPRLDTLGRLTEEGGVKISPRKKTPAASSPRKKGKEEQAAKAKEEEEEEDLPIPPSQTSRQLLNEAKEAEKVFEGAAQLDRDQSSAIPASNALGPILGPTEHLHTHGQALVQPIPPESGLTPLILRGRRDGKKIKGAYLTPDEMRSLAKPWEPYRSLASFYMYTLIDGVAD